MFGKSIRTKLMVLTLMAAVLPTAVSIGISYLYTKESVRENSIEENTRILALGKDNLTNYLSSFHRMALSIYSGINLPNSLYTTILNTKYGSDIITGEGLSHHRDAIASQLHTMYQSNPDIYQIHLYIKASGQSSALLQGFFRREISQSPRIPAEAENKPWLEVTHPAHRYGLQSSIPNLKLGTTEVFSLHYPVLRAPSDEAMAYLSFDLRLSRVEQLARSMYDPRKEQLFIVNDEGLALYSSDPELTGRQIRVDWGRIAGVSGSGHFVWKDASFDGIVMFERMTGPLLTGAVVKMIPYDQLYGDTTVIAGINAAIGVLFLIVGIIAAVLISIRFTSPIKKLISFTQKVKTGQLDAHVDVEREDEIGLLTRKINEMTQTIHHLIVKEYQLEIANKTNQLRALQAQINPHFLYNALQTIGTMSLRYDAVKVYDLIYSLGSIMHYAMTAGSTEVPLRSEVEHVENYLALQKERFGEDLQIQWNVDPVTLSILIPKMILQPIVENIFKHGFEEGTEGGCIVIHSRMDREDCLLLSVSDNGKGQPAKRIAELEEALSRKGSLVSENIGLHNVMARLRLYFGDEAAVTIHPGAGSGLTFTLLIPLSPGRHAIQTREK
ncbi:MULTISPECIES: sensor histidine kinase [Paenibacillus]|uniref:sensor histidine kinase n=1 Tax=Paenibacillus TaxID=44249 RepID=UPI0022B8B750|nr:histidine kinase [Paenibacillus caseinilyticus]MCZ8518305.1 histidine kinase [Paenibacillus caseinilyticus]